MSNEGHFQQVLSSALFGFALWHGLDAVVDHWVLQIHHIKDDAAQPVLWDVVWLVVFGIVPALAAWAIGRNDKGDGVDGRCAAPPARPTADVANEQQRPIKRRARPCALSLLAVVAVVLAAAYSPQSDRAMLLTLPGVSTAQIFDEIDQLDARILWTDRLGNVWSVQLPRFQSASWFPSVRQGVLIFRVSIGLAGCSI
ncbi:DUF2243 domain-containing protein [Caballeronia sp. LZ001]|uniref:DUF2243 domain-containing protein n=1 Tax=Caballeronia sp. LZ001 TaxID=3038553 RepID=UPI00285B5CC5|nr:DUF2243 domain-containing protein [Caballeronia sp. LZ001]MDR5806391.1 DUF2243 domain-containing protein [Caballeronia sp. LZ001]